MSENISEMVLVEYAPFDGCEVIAPSIRPGQKLLVTPAEADRLLALDSFELVDPNAS